MLQRMPTFQNETPIDDFKEALLLLLHEWNDGASRALHKNLLPDELPYITVSIYADSEDRPLLSSKDYSVTQKVFAILTGWPFAKRVEGEFGYEWVISEQGEKEGWKYKGERRIQITAENVRNAQEVLYIYRHRKNPSTSYLVNSPASGERLHHWEIALASDTFRALELSISALENIFGAESGEGDRYANLGECILGDLGAWHQFANLLEKKLVVMCDTTGHSFFELEKIAEYIPQKASQI